MLKRLWKSGGPIVVSAFSLFIAFHFLQPLALALDPSFNLLSSKGIGKIAFMAMVIMQSILLLALQPISFLKVFFKTNISFFSERSWLKTFFAFFSLFFMFHAFTFVVLYTTRVCVFNPTWGSFKYSLFIQWIIGFIATFFLAWSEELIFRGMLYPYFAQFFTPLTSALITSSIFSCAHDLRAPWSLCTTQWKLGLGLFLLGLLLNLIFIITRKLSANMGAHAGLVFLKVLFRKAPMLIFPTPITWWASSDLREAFLVHIFFALACCFLIKRYYQVMIGKESKTL